MKSEVKEVEKPEYPCLMKSQSTGAVYLLTEPRTGTCIYIGDTEKELGEYYNLWNEDDFQPFTGVVTLSN